MLELSMREVESDADFLSPFLAVIENPKALEYEDKIRLKLECLNSFKEVAVERANQLQAKFNWVRINFLMYLFSFYLHYYTKYSIIYAHHMTFP